MAKGLPMKPNIMPKICLYNFTASKVIPRLWTEIYKSLFCFCPDKILGQA